MIRKTIRYTVHQWEHMDELRIDEELLHKCIQQVTVGDYQHRGIKGLLEMIAMAGYRWRTPVKIVLYNSSHDKEKVGTPQSVVPGEFHVHQ